MASPTFSHWMEGQGAESDVVLSSRVRLARNLAGSVFPERMDETAGAAMLEKVGGILAQLGPGWNLKLRPIAAVDAVERQVLVEKHLVSPALVQEPIRFEAVAIDPTETVSLMLNEEDHLRLQVLLPGLELREAFQIANRLDDDLEAALTFAFDPHLGYLTACPTNLGTGLRASVMVHLPALVLTRQLPQVFTALAQIGMVVRGLYGEGTEAAGNIFQISNQVSLGLSEEEFIHNLTLVAEQLVGRERHARQLLQQHHRLELEDRVGRAWGILTHAHIVSSEEALRLLSDVKLGGDLGLIRVPSKPTFAELAVMTRPAFLMARAEKELPPRERDEIRATVLREELMTPAVGEGGA